MPVTVSAPRIAGNSRLEHVVARDLLGPEARRRVGAAGSGQAHSPFGREGGGAARVIAVLVGDEDGGERAGIDARRLEPLGEDPRTKTGVDENAGLARFDEGGVARAARPQHAEAKGRAHAA